MPNRKIAYFNPFSGISGDMTLGAFVDVGLPFEKLESNLRTLHLHGYSIEQKKIKRNGISATWIDVQIEHSHHHRHLSDIREIITSSTLPDKIKSDAIDIFTTLAKAEAQVHDTDIESVHFHEVGAVDAIIDIVGASIAVHELKIHEIHCGKIALGGGTVKCEHGLMPVPAPATAKILEGLPCVGGPVDFELTTPTGAAILKTLAQKFDGMPSMSVISSGFGAGTKEFEHPNLLQIIIGETDEHPQIMEQVSVIETTIDDMTGEEIGFLTELLHLEGAKDVVVSSVHMKKNRPGILLTILCAPDDTNKMGDLILRNSSTRGYRFRLENRIRLSHETAVYDTQYGKVRLKISQIDESHEKSKLEYDDVARVAREKGMTFDEAKKAVMSEIDKYK